MFTFETASSSSSNVSVSNVSFQLLYCVIFTMHLNSQFFIVILIKKFTTMVLKIVLFKFFNFA